MSQEWKLVPLVPTEQMLNVLHDRVLISVNTRKQEANILNDKAWWAAVVSAAPVPPAGGELEDELLGEMNRRFELSKHDDDWLCVDDTQLGVEFAADFMRAHVARLQAENAALQQRLNVADQRVDELQSELAKARDMIALAVKYLYGGAIKTELARYLDLPQGIKAMPDKTELLHVPRELLERICTGCMFTMDAKSYQELCGFLAHQSAPAAKGEEFPSAEIAAEAAAGVYDIDFPGPDEEQDQAPAEDIRAVGDEPVADVVIFNGEKIIDGTLSYMATAQIGDRLYRRPQNKVVMPDRLIFSSCPTQQPYVVGWNACLDELSRLNPQ